ncbi:MAG: NADH pyrophosphatase zinc ribbon domain-containing protein, partial [Cellulomonadaceae bacterium]
MPASSVDWTQLPLTRSDVDRDAERRREPGLLTALRADRSTRVTLVRGAELAVGDDGALARLSPQELAGIDDPATTWLFLGDDAAGADLALVLPRSAAEDRVDIEGVPAGGSAAQVVAAHRWAPLRDMGHELDARDVGLATTAVALAAWHGAHPRCSRCGERTTVVQAGWVRHCPADGTDHLP